jgi:hypothetical protein
MCVYFDQQIYLYLTVPVPLYQRFDGTGTLVSALGIRMHFGGSDTDQCSKYTAVTNVEEKCLTFFGISPNFVLYGMLF